MGQFYNEKTFAPVSVKFPANPPKDEWMLSHIQSFPNNRLYRPKGFVSIFVSQKQLHQMLQPSIPYGGYSYLLNDSGSVLASVGDDKFAKQIEILDISFDADNQTLEKTITSGERMIVSYVVSPYNQWKYVTVTPAYSVIDKARYITQFIWVFMFIALIVGVVISCLMAYKNSKPISKMIRKLVSKKLEKGGAGRGAFDFLTNSIDDLIVHNEEFQTKINQQIPYLKMLVYNFLLENRFKDEQELLFVSSQAEIKLPGGNFTVLVAQLYETKIGDYLPNNMKYLMVILNELVVSNLGPDTIIQNIDFAAVALILNLDEENNSREKLERILKSIQDLFIDKYSCRIVFAGGVTVDNWLYIWSSYEQAKNALDYKGFGTDVVVRWHDKIPQNGSSYFYSVDTESKLITLAKAVDYAGVKKLFGELYIENFVRRHLSVDMMEYFIYDLKGTIVKIVDQVITEDDVQLIQMKKEIDKLHSLNSIEEIFEEVINIYGRICSIIDSQKRSHNTDLADKIIAYLKLNYMEPISLNCVASIFNINEVYLSQFFKEQTGVNFSRFIEQLRIEQSCELLCNTDMTVDHIASQVGYGNRHSYRKAFQRVKGENPSRYKELNGRSAESSQ